MALTPFGDASCDNTFISGMCCAKNETWCRMKACSRSCGSLAAASDPQERLQAFIRHHVSFFAQHMPEMKVLSHEASPKGVSAIKRRYVDLLESILKEEIGRASCRERV